MLSTARLLATEPATCATLSFEEAVHARRSWRAYHPTEVSGSRHPSGAGRRTKLAPSNCNTQPWNVHLVSGATRDGLSRALHEADDSGRLSPDFSWDREAFHGQYGDRRREYGRVYYGNLGIAHDDREGRRKAGANNLSFYGAPHAPPRADRPFSTTSDETRVPSV